VHPRAERELHLPGGELVGDRARVGQRPRQPIELGHHERVAGAARRQRLSETGPVAMRPGQAMIDVDALLLDAERLQGVALGGEVLRVGGDARVADLELGHTPKCVPFIGR
jgi:hypothetical protein